MLLPWSRCSFLGWKSFVNWHLRETVLSYISVRQRSVDHSYCIDRSLRGFLSVDSPAVVVSIWISCFNFVESRFSKPVHGIVEKQCAFFRRCMTRFWWLAESWKTRSKSAWRSTDENILQHCTRGVSWWRVRPCRRASWWNGPGCCSEVHYNFWHQIRSRVCISLARCHRGSHVRSRMWSTARRSRFS